MVFFFNDTATTEIYTLSLHDALPISFVDECLHPRLHDLHHGAGDQPGRQGPPRRTRSSPQRVKTVSSRRSEEHTSELQSRQYLVCRLLLEKKKKYRIIISPEITTIHH